MAEASAAKSQSSDVRAGQLPISSKNNDRVQVVATSIRGPLIADQGSEAPRVVVFLSQSCVSEPERKVGVRVIKDTRKGSAFANVFNGHLAVNFEAPLGPLVHEFVPTSHHRVAHQLRVTGQNCRHSAKVFRMVRNHEEIQRPVQLNSLAR